MRKCFICGTKENLEESHDVPCYLFIYHGNRKGQKNKADKLGRKILCKKHHDEYEKSMNDFLIDSAIHYSERYFKEERRDDTTN
jgi:hypothetical protein